MMNNVHSYDDDEDLCKAARPKCPKGVNLVSSEICTLHNKDFELI